ncbi:hypothetical protein OS493_030895, partial [Desmophyllum pertusum]
MVKGGVALPYLINDNNQGGIIHYAQSCEYVYSAEISSLMTLSTCKEVCCNRTRCSLVAGEYKGNSWLRRNSKEKELKKNDKLLEASEKQVKLLEEQSLKLKNELEKKEKEKSETAKLQEE